LYQVYIKRFLDASLHLLKHRFPLFLGVLGVVNISVIAFIFCYYYSLKEDFVHVYDWVRMVGNRKIALLHPMP
jgi:hypothetical protein